MQSIFGRSRDGLRGLWTSFSISAILIGWLVGLLCLSLFKYGFRLLVQGVLLDYADGVQWQICPNSETYRAIPDWYRPLPFQRFMPHMACLDILIWYAITSLLLFLISATERFLTSQPGRPLVSISRNIPATSSRL